MSPILDIQRRLVEVGRIRSGGRKPERGAGRKLETWRLSSRDRARLDAAAELYGGTVEPWREGEFDIVTETAELPILLIPGQNLSQWYEWYQGASCKRRCDGEREIRTDKPCLCDQEEGERKCKPTTRLSVMLPDVPGLGCWRVETHGYYAAVELLATASLLEEATARGQLFPARLRLDQRRKVEDGQTIRYTVPVIDIDVRLPEALAAAGPRPELTVAPPRAALEAAPPAPGHTPIEPARSGVSVADGLDAVAREAQPAAARANAAAPIGPPVAEPEATPVAVPSEADEPVAETTPPPPPAPEPAAPADAKPSGTASEAQRKKLNVLIGKLRPAVISTANLYAAVAKMRDLDPSVMVELIDGARDDAGDLHWGPLRDSLSKAEAHDLIDRLEKVEAPS